MLAPSRTTSSGYILIEALITSAVALAIIAAAWRVTHSATTLATTATHHTTPACEQYTCVSRAGGYLCGCEPHTHFIIR